MPLYEVEHITPLSVSQKHSLAKDITQIHSQLFTTPSLFVNVRFTDISRHDVYIGGKKVSSSISVLLLSPSLENNLQAWSYNSRYQIYSRKEDFVRVYSLCVITNSHV